MDISKACITTATMLSLLRSRKDKTIGDLWAENPELNRAYPLSQAMYDLCRRGLVQKTKSHGRNLYCITSKGYDFYQERIDQVQIHASIEYFGKRKHGKKQQKQAPQVTSPLFSTEAEEAVNSIAAIVERNQKLEGVLSGIYYQIGTALGLDGKGEK